MLFMEISKQKKNMLRKKEFTTHRFLFAYCAVVLVVAVLYIFIRFMMTQTGHDFQALTWTKTTIDSDGSVGNYNDLAFNGSNQPIISYYDTTNTALKYAVYDGAAWSSETVDNTASVGTYS